MTNNAKYIVNTIIFKMTNDKPYELANNSRKACAVCDACPFKMNGECNRNKYFNECYVAELMRDALDYEAMAYDDEQ